MINYLATLKEIGSDPNKLYLETEKITIILKLNPSNEKESVGAIGLIIFRGKLPRVIHDMRRYDSK